MKRTSPGVATPLADLVEPADYVQARHWVFKGVESWRWFTRRHRAALAVRGAVIEIGGRLLVHATRFDQAVLDLATAGRHSPANNPHQRVALATVDGQDAKTTGEP